MTLGNVDQAIADIAAGKFVIVTDDEDRENEGDLVCAAQLVTPEMVNFRSLAAAERSTPLISAFPPRPSVNLSVAFVLSVASISIVTRLTPLFAKPVTVSVTKLPAVSPPVPVAVAATSVAGAADAVVIRFMAP